MEKQNGMYFTIWYGVYGHPRAAWSMPAAAIRRPVYIRWRGARVTRLEARNMIIAACRTCRSAAREFVIDRPGRLYLFSAGV
jgi:hypothetical protein